MAAFSPNSKTLAIGHIHSVDLWDVETGRMLPGSANPKLEVQSVRFSADGKRVARETKAKIELMTDPRVRQAYLGL